TKERVGLALQVIKAVEYAHRNLIVHRDLKPSNVLVTSSGQVKLLDFGIARLLEEEPQPGDTRTGNLFVTPEYAAPEQIRGETVTTATDVYALGALIYELLTGLRPFGTVGRAWKELERILNDEPPRLSQSEGLDRATRRALEGDLTTIVRKALRKEPNRRYGSARALGDDLRRYLEGRPVAATPDSLGYRASKFVMRNRVACALGALGLLATGFGVAATAWQARAVRVEAERAEAINGFLLSLFEGADPDLNPGEPVTASQLLEAGLARVDSLAVGPRTHVDLLTTMGVLFGKLGHDERADGLLRQAVSTSSAALGPEDLATAEAMDALGVRLALTGVFAEAQDVLTQALKVREAAGADLLDVGTTQGNLAKAMEQAGHLADATLMYQDAIETLNRATEGDSLRFATELMGLAQALEESQRFEEANTLMQTVRRLREEGEGETPALATAVHNIAHLTGLWKDDVEGAERLYREALSMRRRIFPGGHPDIPLTMQEIARVIELRGRWSEADSLYGEAFSEWSDLYGSNHPHLANLRANQANLRYRNGDLDAAAEAYEDIVRLYRVQGDATLTSVSIHNLGVIERERGAYASADSLLAEALELRRSYLEEPHSDIAQSLSSRSMLNNLRGRFDEAEALARASLSQYEAVLPADHSAFVWPRRELGIALVAQGRSDEGAPLLEDAATSLQEMLNAADPQLGRTKLWLGIARVRQGDTDSGRELIEEALESLTASQPSGSPDVDRARTELARSRR
ncbi:MAG: tetratricopeptide repeat protein, partial [Longimicrobiales bacterium]